MRRSLSLAVTLGSIIAGACALASSSCTRTVTDRVLEPVGASGSSNAPSSSPGLADASVAPIGPVADPGEPEPDYHVARAPEFGMGREVHLASATFGATPSAAGMGGSGGIIGGDLGGTGAGPGLGGSTFR
jgi:hypothetical protein